MEKHAISEHARKAIVSKMLKGMSVAVAEETYGVPRSVLRAWLADCGSKRKAAWR